MRSLRVAGWLFLASCAGGEPSDVEDAHPLEASSYRFCHEPGLDAEFLGDWCDRVDEIPEEVCPGLRASCEGAEPSTSTDGCNGEDSSSGKSSDDKGAAGEPEPPPEPWRMDWEAPDLAFLGDVARWVLALVVALCIGVLVVFLVQYFRRRDDAPAVAVPESVALVVDESELDEALPEVPSAPSGDLLAMARKALDDGRSGEAVMLARGAALRRLGEIGRLRLHRSRTDREYVRLLGRGEDDGEAPAGGSDELRVVVNVAERFRFGHREPPVDMAQQALSAAARLLGGMALGLALLWAPVEAAAQTAHRYRPYGDAAFAELFEQHGFEVRWRLTDLEGIDDDDVDILVLDPLALEPTPEEWAALRRWVTAGHVLVSLGNASAGFPELGQAVLSEASSLDVSDPLASAGLQGPVLPRPFQVYEPETARYHEDGLGAVSEGWAVDPDGREALGVVAVGSGVVVSLADSRSGDNVFLAVPANAELLGELPWVGQAHGWPIATPARVQLALRASTVSSEETSQNPFESLARAELLPFVLQFLLLWATISLWKGWPMGPLKDPPHRGRIRFADHVEALGERYERLRAGRHVLRAYAGLWLQRVGPKGLQLAATQAGWSPDDAKRFVADLEELVAEDDEGGFARPSARQAAADLKTMEALWKIVEHPKDSPEHSE